MNALYLANTLVFVIVNQNGKVVTIGAPVIVFILSCFSSLLVLTIFTAGLVHSNPS